MKKLTLTRTFDAPIEVIWQAWTDPEVLMKWWAPAGMHCSYLSANVQENGRLLYCFKRDDDGTEYWGRGIYKTITEPTYLSYLDSFTDPEGNDVPPSYYDMPGEEVAESLVEITLKEDAKGTHLTLVADNPFDDSEPIVNDMMAGWNGMFDKLSAALKSS